MARKKVIVQKKSWTDADLENFSLKSEIDKDYVSLYIEELEKIFKDTFCFTPKQIESTIEKIFDESNERALDVLVSICSNFANLESAKKNLTKEEMAIRNRHAKRIVNIAFKLFSEKGENLEKMVKNYFKSLKLIERQGIDPFAITHLQTIRSKNLVDDFQKAVSVYLEKATTSQADKKYKFKEKDLYSMIESCSSILFNLNEQRIRQVIDLIDNFTFDKETNSYVPNVDFKSMLIQVPSLLTKKPEEIKGAISFLEENYIDKNDPQGRIKLVQIVNKSPSLLAVDPKRITALEKALIDNGLTEKDAHDYCYDIKNLTGLTTINPKSIPETKEILIEFFGEKNALVLLKDNYVLHSNPSVIKYVLTELTILDSQDKPDNFVRRNFIMKNPHYLKYLESGLSVSVVGDYEKTSRSNKDRSFENIQALTKSESDLKGIKLNKQYQELADTIIGKIESDKSKKDNEIIVEMIAEETEVSKERNSDNSGIVKKINEEIAKTPEKDETKEQLLRIWENVKNIENPPMRSFMLINLFLRGKVDDNYKELLKSVEHFIKVEKKYSEKMNRMIKRNFWEKLKSYDELDLKEFYKRINSQQFNDLSTEQRHNELVGASNRFVSLRENILKDLWITESWMRESYDIASKIKEYIIKIDPNYKKDSFNESPSQAMDFLIEKCEQIYPNFDKVVNLDNMENDFYCQVYEEVINLMIRKSLLRKLKNMFNSYDDLKAKVKKPENLTFEDYVKFPEKYENQVTEDFINDLRNMADPSQEHEQTNSFKKNLDAILYGFMQYLGQGNLAKYVEKAEEHVKNNHIFYDEKGIYQNMFSLEKFALLPYEDFPFLNEETAAQITDGKFDHTQPYATIHKSDLFNKSYIRTNEPK